ncbi:MAG: hypothetical protein M1816_007212 [Peltula sp. TS41687]|nr:MAG: hypothetical protein M1816_007212 [Peltula sp. TS41687]
MCSQRGQLGGIKPGGLSIRPTYLTKHDSRQSTQTNNADRWFDDSNKNVRGERGSDYMDDDPPFYLKERPDPEIPHREFLLNRNVLKSGQLNISTDDLAVRSYMQSLDLNRDRSEDYRSVIDDLTVQNQRLKRKLRKYEKMHSSHLQDDKLFEVTFHGLGPEKRRELEDRLKEFVFCSDESSSDTHASSEFARQHLPSDGATSNVGASSYESQSRPPLDSGYGSVSISGQTSTSPSYHSKRPPIASDKGTGLVGLAQSNDTTLLNNHAKRSLIAERLEQLFTGNALRGRPYNQPLTQQSLIGSAFPADRMNVDHKDQNFNHHGAREARILAAGIVASEININAGQDEVDSNMASGAPSPTSTPSSSEQRPTRPLDLDLRRTQYPAENRDYIRHLGMSTPSIDHAIDSEPTEGWVYFNLLVNMAQLHTVNVTPEFIRQAVVELSANLELSEDGRKIRWKGGTQGTKMSSSGADRSSPEEGDQNWVSEGRRGKRNDDPKSRAEPASAVLLANGAGNHPLGHATLRGNSENVTAGSYQPNPSDRFYYKPLFFHKNATDDEDSDGSYSPYSRESSLSPEGFGSTGYVGQTSIQDETVQRSLKRRRSEFEGPLIFYKKARFCTDLSGDRLANVRNRCEGLSYQHVTEEVIGCHSTSLDFQHDIDSSFLRNHNPATAEKKADEFSLEESIISFDTEPLSSMIEAQQTEAVHASSAFEVSGLAGVQPTDHFMVNVHTCRKIMPRHQSGFDAPGCPRGYGVGRTRSNETCATGLLSQANKYHSSCGADLYTDEILSATRIDLPPSTLPPPSCVYRCSSPSLSDDQQSSSSSDNSDEEDYDDHYNPPQLTRMFSTLSTSGPDDPTSSRSSSIDLLASLRKDYPLLIAEQEKEYDERCKDLSSRAGSVSDDEDEIGSSAAIAGDNSPFTSSSASSSILSPPVSPFTRMPDLSSEMSKQGCGPCIKRTVGCVDNPLPRMGRDKMPRVK